MASSQGYVQLALRCFLNARANERFQHRPGSHARSRVHGCVVNVVFPGTGLLLLGTLRHRLETPQRSSRIGRKRRYSESPFSSRNEETSEGSITLGRGVLITGTPVTAKGHFLGPFLRPSRLCAQSRGPHYWIPRGCRCRPISATHVRSPQVCDVWLGCLLSLGASQEPGEN